jgi:hypothetical protein
MEGYVSSIHKILLFQMRVVSGTPMMLPNFMGSKNTKNATRPM